MLIAPFDVDKYIPWNAKLGRPEPCWWRRAVLPDWLTVDTTQSNPFAISAAGSITPSGIFRIEHSSMENYDDGLGNPILVNKLTFADSTAGQAAANWTVFVRDMGDKTQFMNQPIHIRNFAGSAQLAAKVSEPWFIPRQHILQVQFAKVTGGAVNTRLYFCGMRFNTWSPHLLGYPEDRKKIRTIVGKLLERRKYVYPYWMTTEETITLSATIGAVAESDAIVSDDGHFEATHIVGVGSGGNFGLEIINPETKQTYMNGIITQTNAIGTAFNPAELPVPLFLPSGTRLRFRFTNQVAISNRCDVALRGRRFRAPLKDWDEVRNDFSVAPEERALLGI